MMTDPFALSPAGKRALYREVVRRSLGAFHIEAFRMLHGGEPLVPGQHIDAMVHVLEQLALGDIKRLVINLPPRHGKSELISGSFAAWVLGNDPKAKVTIVSYGDALSIPLVDKARSIVRNARYRQFFPETVIKRGKDRSDHFEVTGGGGVRAASKNGAMTGLGTHFMIVDDFHKAGESLSPVERERAIQTFQATFFNRFDNLADGRLVIVQQRIHEDDLPGWALRTGEWPHLNLPAIAEQDEDIPLSRGAVWHRRKGDVLAPVLAPREYLEEQRMMMGPRNFGAQFQQNPIVADGGLIDLNWFDQYDERPPRSFFHKVVQSWDPAITERITADYSVGMTWGFRDGRWYLLDLIRIQAAFTKLTERVVAWHKQWRADALVIEGASIGIALYDQIKAAKLPGVLRCPTPQGSKLDRLAGHTVQLQTGDFLLPASADWLPALRHELLAFPDGRNDDQVDALTQFLEFAFGNRAWVEQQFDSSGRRIRGHRPQRQSRFYGGDIPSSQSWSN
jgi:predicted phage terminase large subunit-like protein